MNDSTRAELVGTYLDCARGYIERVAGIVSEMPVSTRDTRQLAATDLSLAMEDLRRAQMHLRAFPVDIEGGAPGRDV